MHKGSARETFVREFLSDHLPTSYGIGTGEIVDCKSKASEPRNQHDLVVYEHDFPRIYLGGGINAYLRESVIATIEVKPTLEKDELNSAAEAAMKLKRLLPTGSLPMVPIATYVVAFKAHRCRYPRIRPERDLIRERVKAGIANYPAPALAILAEFTQLHLGVLAFVGCGNAGVKGGSHASPRKPSLRRM